LDAKTSSIVQLVT